MCKDIEKLIEKNQQWDDIFIHLQDCPHCRNKYLLEEPYKILKAYEEIQQEEDFWIKERAAILEKILGRELKIFKWLKYAAFVFLPTISLLIISIHLFTMKEHKIIKEQPAMIKEEFPSIIEIKNPNAHYYKIKIDENTHLIMVVDPNIELR